MIKLIIFLFPILAFSALTEPDRAEFTSKNLLKELNPGGENGKVKWIATGGTVASETNTLDIFTGNGAISWDPSASSQYVASGTGTKKSGMGAGSNGVAFCYVRATDTDYTMEVNDTTNTLSVRSVPSSSVYNIVSLNFVFTSNSGYQIRFNSASNAGKIYIDDCYIGPAGSFNVNQVSQAQLYGAVIWPSTASCDWTRTSTSQGGFSADADCTLPAGSNIIGNASAPATKIPAITFSTMPPGHYKFTATGAFAKNNTSAGSSGWRFHDGTTGTDASAVFANGIIGYSPTIVGWLTYTTGQSNKTIEIQCAQATSGSCDILNSSSTFYQLRISVEYFPITAQDGFTADNVGAQVWSGYHSNNCTWTTTSTSYADPSADASCTFGETSNTNFGTVTSNGSGFGTGTYTPSITISANQANVDYWVCASVNGYNSATSGYINWKLTDGTTDIDQGENRQVTGGGNTSIAQKLCGPVKFSSTGSQTIKVQILASTGTSTFQAVNRDRAIYWSIFKMNSTAPAPNITQSVVAPQYSGVLNICAADYQTTITGTQAPDREVFGDCFGSATRSGTGTYAQPINSGIFSSAPQCWITSNNASAGNYCTLNGVPTTSSIPITCYAAGGAAADGRPNIVCMGPK